MNILELIQAISIAATYAPNKMETRVVIRSSYNNLEGQAALTIYRIEYVPEINSVVMFTEYREGDN